MMIVWVLWGYSIAFGGGTSPFWGGFGKLFLSGVTTDDHQRRPSPTAWSCRNICSSPSR